MNKVFTCIVCPRGCQITVDDNMNVYGNTCPRGKDYVLSEITLPTRIITSTVRVINRRDTVVSVKTTNPIPKDKMFEMMQLINMLKVEAPVSIGTVLIEHPLDLQTSIIVTKNID